MLKLGKAGSAAVFGLLALPWTVVAQSAIAGRVTDTTGAVLPGVAVEASSPALIEGVRAAVTDSQGRYTIIDVRPGTYSVSFALAGFTTVVRQEIEVGSNVNVPINAVLAVGALEESVTVSGATPVVDVQAAARTEVLPRETLNALPTNRTWISAGAIVPGARMTKPDVGGSDAVQQAYVTARGMAANDNGMQIDGMDVKPNNEAGNQQYPNFAMVQEVTYQTSAIPADTSSGGVRINMIPREGGNGYSGEMFYSVADGGWQSNNITPELLSRGLATTTSTDLLYDVNPGFGGPLRRDRLWFFGSYRRLVVNTRPAGAFFRDGRPAIEDQWIDSGSLRLTWQAAAQHKITMYGDRQWKGKGHDFTDGVPAEVTKAGIDPETASSRRDPRLYYVAQGKLTSTLSSRLLVESGWSLSMYKWSIDYQPGVGKPRGTPEWFAGAARVDIARGTLTTAANFSPRLVDAVGHQLSSAVSYVTGSHTFKTGVQWRFGPAEDQIVANADLTQRYRNGVPENVDVYTTPLHTKENLNADLGVYVQDSWTVGRLTLNPGLRLEYLNASIEQTSMAAGRFVPERFIQEVPDLPNWFDAAPRVSAVYDLFGNAKTALKFSSSRYNQPIATGFAKRYNPTVYQSDRRDWFDTDLIPGTSRPSGQSLPTNGDDIAQDNEIGPSNNRNFGFATSRRPDPDLSRPYTWEHSVGVQHELLPRVSLLGAWYRRSFRNLEGQYNALIDLSSDYTPFQSANPVTGELVTVYNLNRNRQGLVEIVDRNSDINKRAYNGFEVSFTGRLRNGGMLLGGWSMERTVAVTCDTDDPNRLRFCDQTGATYQELGSTQDIPFRHEFKLAGAYPLPWGIQSSMSLLSYPGQGLGITWPVPANLFPGGRTQAVNVPLIAPGTKFLNRWNQMDIAIKKAVRVGRVQLRPQVEIFNLLNSSVVLSENQTLGPSLGRPTGTLQGRLVRAGMIATF
jgi:hypothetical protein